MEIKRNQNYLQGNLYQFRLRYTFDNNEKSVWSPISKLVLPKSNVTSLGQQLEMSQSISNAIKLTFDTQDEEVIAIEIAVRLGNLGQWALVDKINKYDQDWNILVASNITYEYLFYNDKVTFGLDQDDCARPFDYVPQVAECTELINENQLVDANITEGYDNIDTNVTTYYNLSSTEDLDGKIQEHSIENNFQQGTTLITFGAVDVGSITKATASVPDQSINVVAQAYCSEGENVIDVVDTIYEIMSAQQQLPVERISNYTIKITNPYYQNNSMYVTAVTSTVTNTVPSYKYGKTHRFGIVYYDRLLRCGAVNEVPSVFVPYYNEHFAGQFFPTNRSHNKVDIGYEIRHLPPVWAKYWQWAYAENYGLWEQFTVELESKDNDGEYCYIPFNKCIRDFNTKISESSIQEWVFEKGDRIRLIGRVGYDNYSIRYEGTVRDYEILASNVDDGTLKVRYDSEVMLGSLLFEVYRKPLTFPEGVGEQHFEIGELNPVLSPYTNDRSHGHINPNHVNQRVVNGSNEFPAIGWIDAHDSYIKVRTFYRTVGGIVTEYIKFPAQTINFSDYFDSKVHNRGRINVVDVNARRVKLPDAFRWSGEYVQQSRFNNLSRFDYADFDFVTEKYGAITRLKQVGEVLQCRQQYRSTSIYVGRVELRQSAINEQGFVAVSERLLGTRYVSKEKWGCVNPESEVQSGQISYYFDLNNGAIIADGYNKPQPISDLGLRNYVRSLAETLKGKKNVRVVGEYDRNDLLWYTFTADDFTPVTLVWKEGWKCFVELPDVDCYSCIGDTFLAFKDGKVYKMNTGAYNTWFGEFKPSVVNVVFNANPDQNKIFRRLRIHSDSMWTAGAYGDLLIQPSPTFAQGMQTKMPIIGLTDEEGMYYGDVPRNAGFPPTLQRWVNGEPMRGTAMRVRLTNAETKQVSLFSVGCVEQPT